MSLLSLNQVSLTLGTRPLFTDLTLTLNPGDRIGLVGHNGSGKSSLLQLIAGQLESDSGRCQYRRNLIVALVSQFVPEALQGLTVREAAEAALPDARRELEAHRAGTELHKLGFSETQFDQKVRDFSGGQQNLLLMARAILTEPDVLLLDEPGNHMDILSLTRLRQWLEPLQIPWVMVSHDRYLLNTLCRQTWVLRDRRLYAFNLPFDAAREALARQDLDAEARRSVEEKEVARLEASAKRLHHWGRTYDNEDLSRKAKTMEKRAQRLKDDFTFVTQGSGLALALPEEGLTARQVLVLENLSVTLPDDGRELVYCDFLNVRPGDRIALLGINGSGKSTTLNRIVNALGLDAGPIRWNPRARLGYYDQLLDDLNSPLSRFEWLRERVEGQDEAIRQTLLAAGVPYDRFDQPVQALSGGEKARIVFALFRLRRPNVLVLDEPTNHIDLDGREELIESLVQGGMTVMITSHDRSFLEQTATRWWLIDRGRLVETHEPDTFYRALEREDCTEPRAHASPDERPARAPGDEADMLQRIDELETLLEEDQARKPKHQKPERQEQWKRELQRLWGQLE